MEILLNEEKEKYFLKLAQEGAKLPHHFNVETIITPEEETETSKLQKQLKIMQDQMAQMMRKKDKPVKTFTMDALCPFPIDKSINMPPFPRGVELPKYDKYFGTTDPQDHLRKFGALSMEFIHDQTYLMHLFPRSLGGQALEWFSHLPPSIKTFDEISTSFVQQCSHNIQHLINI